MYEFEKFLLFLYYLLNMDKTQFEKRVKQFRTIMSERNLNAVIVVDPVNLYYLTGQRFVYPHTVRFSTGLITEDEAVMIVPTIEKNLADEHSWIKDIRTYGETPNEDKAIDPVLVLSKTINDLQLSNENIGIEANHLVHSIYTKLINELPSAKFFDSTHLLEQQRMIKSAEEIMIVKKAAQLGDKAISAAIDAVDEGVTEREVAEAARSAMSLDDGYWTIVMYPGTGVASGPRSAISHYRARNKKIEKNEFVVMDLCALIFYEGYHVSDSRTAIVGQPTLKQKKVYDCTLDAANEAINTIEPGVRACDVDAAAGKAIKKGGYGEYLTHGSGHAIGLHYYEKPYLRFYDRTVLKPGMYFNVSCGIAIPGFLGTSCENTVLVTEKGHELLTKYPLELQIK
jgi:Xaa-Pro dipeptidase